MKYYIFLLSYCDKTFVTKQFEVLIFNFFSTNSPQSSADQSVPNTCLRGGPTCHTPQESQGDHHWKTEQQRCPLQGGGGDSEHRKGLCQEPEGCCGSMIRSCLVTLMCMCVCMGVLCHFVHFIKQLNQN